MFLNSYQKPLIDKLIGWAQNIRKYNYFTKIKYQVAIEAEMSNSAYSEAN